MKRIAKTIDNLIIEVTRLCNMQCDHCLRGRAENVMINEEYIATLLEDVSYIYSVTFTGGEPTLNVKAISFFFKEVKKRNIELGYFWLATNGKVFSNELLLELVDAYSWVNEPEYCGIAVSKDDFHDTDPTVYKKYQALSFYDSSKENLTTDNLINMGLAEEFGIGVNYHDITEEMEIEIQDEESVRIETLYLNAKGEILADCDISFDLQEDFKICRVEELDEHIRSTEDWILEFEEDKENAC